MGQYSNSVCLDADKNHPDRKYYLNCSVQDLLERCQNEDPIAKNFFRIHKFNEEYPVGSSVWYTKSELEGNVLLKVAKEAYLLSGIDTPVVELEAIGIALLNKIEPPR